MPTRRKLASSASLLAALGSLAPLTVGASAPDPDRKATAADYARLEFEPIPGVREAVGTREEWLAEQGKRFPTFYMGAATLGRTSDQLRDMAAAEPEAVADMLGCIQELSELLRAEAEVMEAAAIRLMSGACRAGLI